MPVNPHFIKKGTSDPGTAQMVADVHRRIAKLESQGGLVAPGATVTGPRIPTADTGPRVVLQGPLFGGGEGIFMYGPSAALAVPLTPPLGLVLNEGTSPWNQVTWQDGSSNQVGIVSTQTGTYLSG